MEGNIKALFISYLEKSISPKDEELLIEWIKNNPDSLKEWSELGRLWNLVNVAQQFDNELIEQEWKLLLGKIQIKKEFEKQSGGIFLYWLPRIAAVFLLGAVFSAAVFYTILNHQNNQLVYHEITTPAGAKSKVTLPDGSEIWLNAGSSLKYSNQFGKKNREVFLSGEAFFDVVSNKLKVFVVEASELKIKAYGTSFNVKSYPEENTVEATLIEGSIGIVRTGFDKKKHDEIVLERNQRVVYYRPTQNIKEIAEEEITNETKPVSENREKEKLTYMISKGIDPVEFTSWKEGKLIISSDDLGNIAVMLERKYDIKIHFETEKLKKLKFTGTIENETVEHVIEAIGISAHIDYEIEDRDVFFKEKPIK
jgi:ferric-dicitrate binding protein FerR (iron transport regulator)